MVMIRTNDTDNCIKNLLYVHPPPLPTLVLLLPPPARSRIPTNPANLSTRSYTNYAALLGSFLAQCHPARLPPATISLRVCHSRRDTDFSRRPERPRSSGKKKTLTLFSSAVWL